MNIKYIINNSNESTFKEISGRTSCGTEPERAPEPSAQPALRRTAAACGDWPCAHYPASPDPG